MQTALLIILATLPVVVIMLYINNRDAEKEPPKLLFKLFALGILSAFIAAIASSIVCMFIDDAFAEGSALHLIITYVIGVGLIEELSKWFFSYRFGYKDKNCNEPFDPLIYCIFVSLGFAFIENIMYVLDQSTFGEALVVAGLRGFAAVPGHASDAAFMGFFLMQAWKCAQKGDKSGEKRFTILSILAPTVTHALYDISCELSDISELIWIIAVIGVYVVMIYSVNKTAGSAKEWAKDLPQQPVNYSPITRGDGGSPFATTSPPGNTFVGQPTTSTHSVGGVTVTNTVAANTHASATVNAAPHAAPNAVPNAAPKFCGECGAPAESGHKFCPHCGKKLL